MRFHSSKPQPESRVRLPPSLALMAWNIKSGKWVYWQVASQDQKRLGLRKYPYPYWLFISIFDRPSHSLPILSFAGQVAHCDPIRSSITNFRHPGQPGLCCLLFLREERWLSTRSLATSATNSRVISEALLAIYDRGFGVLNYGV